MSDRASLLVPLSLWSTNKQLSAEHLIFLTTKFFGRNIPGKIENEINFIKLPTKLKGRNASDVQYIVFLQSCTQWVRSHKTLTSPVVPFSNKGNAQHNSCSKEYVVQGTRECISPCKGRTKVHQTKCFYIAIALQKSKDKVNTFRNISISCGWSQPGSSLCPSIHGLDRKSRYRWKHIYICTFNICAVLRSVLLKIFYSLLFWKQAKQICQITLLQQAENQYLLYKFFELSDIHQIYKRNGLCRLWSKGEEGSKGQGRLIEHLES